MTAKLIEHIPGRFISAADAKTFFGGTNLQTIKDHWEVREKPKLGVPADSCKTNLFFGFFSTAPRTTMSKQRSERTIQTHVVMIYISTFGFSRGATQARAFTNWLMALCKLDVHLCGRAGAMTLGGFDVQFDFLGIFDTVASVGAGNTAGSSVLGRLFENKRQAAIEYSRTGQTPRMLTEGREPWALSRGGYLRFRKVYAGRDSVLISNKLTREPADTAVA
ncbi:hypothetical protein LJR289_004847 [Pseudoduganella sp. LjRoot289]|uniref:hypothetical protein n=1 Tax=Pseudoduganella sp. LjRoot289 TaxID=3342314 RepID=UPI003ECDB7A7